MSHPRPSPRLLGLHDRIEAPPALLITMLRRLEAATSRLEDMASASYPNGEQPAATTNGAQSPGPGGKLAGATTAPASASGTPKAPVESLPPAIEAFDQMADTELKGWLELSSKLGEVVEGQVCGDIQASVRKRDACCASQCRRDIHWQLLTIRSRKSFKGRSQLSGNSSLYRPRQSGPTTSASWNSLKTCKPTSRRPTRFDTPIARQHSKTHYPWWLTGLAVWGGSRSAAAAV